MKPNAGKSIQTIVLVGGDKGGVGKSTVTRTLVDYYQQEKVDFIAYDGDDTNPTFTRFYGRAERLSTRTPKGFEPLIANLEGGPAVQLVDLGAGSSMMLAEFTEATGFLYLAQEHGAKVTFVFVLAPTVDSINLLKILSEQYGDQIRYIVARNQAMPGNWDLWEKSKTRASVLGDLGGIELTIPRLDEAAFAVVDRLGLPWGEALQKREVTLVTRSYVFRWRQKVFAELAKAQEVLR